MSLIRVLKIQIVLAVRTMFEYRADFWIHLVLSFLWTLAVLLPLWVLFQHSPEIAGWAWHDALLVAGFFTLLLGLIEGMVQPSLTALVESFRTGNMDFLLLKPVDPQILISTLKIEPWNATDLIAGSFILGYALNQRPHPPGFEDLLATSFFFLCALILIYDLTFFAAALGVIFVKVDNLIYLFLSLFDAARWPSSIFRGGIKFIFTFVIPISLMTTFPAEALRGQSTFAMGGIALGVTTLFTILARLSFHKALRHYISAGG